jgi:TPR repeat protein
LGVIYDTGQGVAQDHAEAAKWHRLAAARGYIFAQYNLGVWYAEGQGSPQNAVMAHMWLSLASAKGVGDGAKHRDRVAKLMTPQQIAEAQKLARDCLARNLRGCG